MANPYASVVICTIGHPAGVLEDLKKQTFQGFEVIIASEKGIVNAMNLALERARGEIFIRVDDDVEIPEKWLENLITPFLSNPMIAGVTGPTFVPKVRRECRDSIKFAENPGWFLRWLYDNGDFNPGGIRKCGCPSYDSNFEERFWSCDTFKPDHLEGTNWAMRTQLIRMVGGFDPKFDGVAEWYDTDVEAKIKKLGYHLLYNPKAYLYHMLEKGPQYHDRFEGWGRIKNFLRYHIRHGKFHYKIVVYLAVLIVYFMWRRFRRL